MYGEDFVHQLQLDTLFEQNNKTLYLFDTWDGIPEDQIDIGRTQYKNIILQRFCFNFLMLILYQKDFLFLIFPYCLNKVWILAYDFY